MSNDADTSSGTYLDEDGLALQAAAAVKNDPRSQNEIADHLDVTPGAISQAINPEYGAGRLRKLRIRIIEVLLGYEVRGPVFHIDRD